MNTLILSLIPSFPSKNDIVRQHLAHWITYRQTSLDLSHAWGNGGGGGSEHVFLLWLTVQPGDFKQINVRGGVDRLLSVYSTL